MKERPFYKVDLPPQSDVEIHLLALLSAATKPAEPHIVYIQLADKFELSSMQRQSVMPTTKENAWHNRVRQARRALVNQRLMDASKRGLWSLTDEGRKKAAILKTPLSDL